MNIDEIKGQFNKKQSLYDDLKKEAFFALEKEINRRSIKIHSIPSRVKEVDSFINKIQKFKTANPNKKIDPFSDIKDIVGLRVVCLYLSDIKNVRLAIRKIFKVATEDNKIDDSELTSFGYMSVHFIVTMKKTYKGPRYDQIRDVPFEIQVRTIAMDAWANISHHLDYKSAESIPEELKRDFYAMSGLFYVADKHFEMFFRKSFESRKQTNKQFRQKKTPMKIKINLDSLTSYLKHKLPNRKHADSKSMSDLITELFAVGYKTIGDIEKLLDKGLRAFLLYEEENPPNVENENKYSDVGVIRITLRIIDDNYFEHMKKYLSKEVVRKQAKLRTKFKKYIS